MNTNYINLNWLFNFPDVISNTAILYFGLNRTLHFYLIIISVFVLWVTWAKKKEFELQNQSKTLHTAFTIQGKLMPK